MQKVVVAIPSYNRPESLGIVLKRLLNFENVNKVVVVADASSEEMLRLYKKTLSECPKKVVAELYLGYRGSVKTRSALLKLVTQNIGKVEYVLFLDDDFLLPQAAVIQTMVEDFGVFDEAGVVGGWILNLRKHKVDPEFRAHVPRGATECLTKFTGFLFGGNWPTIFHGKATSPFMLVRSSLLSKISYDENYGGTGYREESDLQRQIFRLGFKIVSDRRAYAHHFAMEEGGIRDQGEICKRMYWKARNHTYFILKWNSNRLIRSLWYIFCCSIILTLYRPSCFREILKGLKDGYKTPRPESNNEVRKRANIL